MKLTVVAVVSSAAVVVTEARYGRGYKPMPWPENLEMRVADLSPAEIANAPDAIDWSTNATTPVKDQKNCGSCWAFSTTEGVESAVFMSTGKLPVHLSTEELVDCEKQDDGCNGGDIPEAVAYLKKHGMASSTDYPDTSSKSGKGRKCSWNKKSVVKVTGMQYAIPPCKKGDCSKQNEEALAAALAKYGPLSICINSGDRETGDWEKYKGGVLKGKCLAQAKRMDHCVQLVGYDKKAAEPYWKVRNSWAADWGENGFIRLPYGNENSCCVGCEAVIISATTSDELVV